jgi:hypothetical protein
MNMNTDKYEGYSVKRLAARIDKLANGWVSALKGVRYKKDFVCVKVDKPVHWASHEEGQGNTVTLFLYLWERHPSPRRQSSPRGLALSRLLLGVDVLSGRDMLALVESGGFAEMDAAVKEKVRLCTMEQAEQKSREDKALLLLEEQLHPDPQPEDDDLDPAVPGG